MSYGLAAYAGKYTPLLGVGPRPDKSPKFRRSGGRSEQVTRIRAPLEPASTPSNKGVRLFRLLSELAGQLSELRQQLSLILHASLARRPAIAPSGSVVRLTRSADEEEVKHPSHAPCHVLHRAASIAATDAEDAIWISSRRIGMHLKTDVPLGEGWHD